MRLIDADSLIQKLYEMKAKEEQYIGLENDVSVMIGSIGFEVMNMPTAYDIDKVRADVVEFISDELIYPLLDECDRGLWEHINHIELAEEWIKVLDNNPYPKVKNHTEARKRDLRQWIAEKLKEQKND